MTPLTKCIPEEISARDIDRRYVGRFAPTPSGPLHQGSLVAALGSYLDARAHQGIWRLRIDNLDHQRCRPDTAEQIIAQLEAHGLIPDESIIWQDTRRDAYAAALDQLIGLNRAYRCRCRRNALREGVENGTIQMGLAGPRYPGTCRGQPIGPDERAGWRFQVPPDTITLWDRRLGQLAQQLTDTIGDPLLQRADGVFAYHLAEVVDNADLSITDVVRGADLAPLTPLHGALHQALFPLHSPPRYLHLPVLFDSTGKKLSKTNHAPPLNLRQARANLQAAAQTLGLPPGGPNDSQEALLHSWTIQWQQLFVAGQQSVDPLEASGQ